jgi:hypothetical protein
MPTRARRARTSPVPPGRAHTPVPISNPTKVLYPAVGFTKADVAATISATIVRISGTAHEAQALPGWCPWGSSTRRMPHDSRPPGFPLGPSLVGRGAHRSDMFS